MQQKGRRVGKARTMAAEALAQRLCGPAVCCPARRWQLSVSTRLPRMGRSLSRADTNLLDDRPIMCNADVLLLDFLLAAAACGGIAAEQASHAGPPSILHFSRRQAFLWEKRVRWHFLGRLRLPHPLNYGTRRAGAGAHGKLL